MKQQSKLYFAAAPAQAAPSLVGDEVRTVQFVIERSLCPIEFPGCRSKQDVLLPIAVWVEWPSIKPHGQWCDGVKYRVTIEDATAARSRFGLRIKQKRHYVCEHMGRLIE